MDDFRAFLRDAGISESLEVFEENGKRDIGIHFANGTRNFWSLASKGTQSLSLLYFWLLRFQEPSPPSLILIDEFDAYYHPALAELVVKNLWKTSGQVLLITHDTHLLSNDLVRPDCGFIMSPHRIDPLFALTDREIRFAHNLEKMYLAGAFRA